MADNNQGNEDLLCKRSSWSSVTTFVLLNYVAHCATVKSYPGETVVTSTIAAIMAFLFPSSGIRRAWTSIVRHARFKRGTELERACRAGALCMVVRTKTWKLGEDELIRAVEVLEAKSKRDGSELRSTADTWYEVFGPDWCRERLVTFDMTGTRVHNIHGMFSLPYGYNLAVVPSDALVTDLYDMQLEAGREGTTMSLVTRGMASFYNAPKSLAALVQTLSACFTLYRARGRQIEQYGYAAFGLTVIPYLFMSICNLIAQLTTPEYPTMFMVRTAEMDEAEKRGAKFYGVVGLLDTATTGQWMVDTPPRQDLQKFSVIQGRIVNQITGEIVRDVSLHPILDSEYERLVDGQMRKRQDFDIVRIPTCGEIARRKPSASKTERGWRRRMIRIAGPAAVSSLSLIAIAVLSHGFSNGQSTKAQRGWTLSWNVVGMLLGGFGQWIGELYFESVEALGFKNWIGIRQHFKYQDWIASAVPVLFAVACSVPAIGGMVVVVQMLADFGNCIRW